MKNLSLILNGILLAALVVLYVLFFTSKNQVDDDITENIPSALDVSSGIVYINIDSVSANYDMNFDLRKSLEEKAKTSDAQLKSRERDYQRKVEDYQYKVQRGLVTRSEAAEIEQNIMQEQQALLQLQNQLQGQLAEEEAVAYRKVLNSIEEYLKSLESTHQYQIILGRSFGGNVLYANDKLNITRQVIDGLNAAYQKSIADEE